MFGRNSKVNLELNREVEKLIKTGGKEQLLPIVQAYAGPAGHSNCACTWRSGDRLRATGQARACAAR